MSASTINLKNVSWESYLTYPLGIIYPNGEIKFILEEGQKLPVQENLELNFSGRFLSSLKSDSGVDLIVFQHYGENVKGLYGPKGNGYSAVCNSRFSIASDREKFAVALSANEEGDVRLEIENLLTGKKVGCSGRAQITKLPLVEKESCDRYLNLHLEILKRMVSPPVGYHLNMIGDINYRQLVELKNSLDGDGLAMFDQIVVNLLDHKNQSVQYLSSAIVTNYALKEAGDRVKSLIASGSLSESDLRAFDMLKSRVA